MTKEGILTDKDVIRSMLIETQNTLTKSLITERLFQRANIKNQLDDGALKRMGANQEAIRQTTKLVSDLKEFLKSAKDENPLADIFPQE